MKQNSLVQLILIYIGITTFLSGFSYIIPRILHLIGNFTVDKTITGSEDNYLLIEIVRIAIGLIFIFKSAGLSAFIIERVGIDNSLRIYTRPAQLFSILLIIMALAHLLEHTPFTLYNITLLFLPTPANQKGTSGIDYTLQQWLVNICNLVIPVLVIVYCPRLTKYFLRNIVAEDKDKLIEHETITIEGE